MPAPTTIDTDWFSHLEDLGDRINLGVAMLGSRKGEIKVPPGDHAISVPAVLGDGHMLHLANGASVACQVTAALQTRDLSAIVGYSRNSQLIEPPGLVVVAPWTDQTDPAHPHRQHAKGVLLQDFAIIGDPALSPQAAAVTIGVCNGRSWTIRGVDLLDTHALGISLGWGSQLGFCAEDIKVIDCTFDGLPAANVCPLNARDSHVRGNTFMRLKSGSIAIDAEPNQLTDVLRGIKIEGNVIDLRDAEQNCSGIYVQQLNPDMPCGGISVLNNDILGEDPYGGIPYTATKASVAIAINIKDAKVSGNQMFGFFSQTGVMMYGMANHCMVSDNRFQGAGVPGGFYLLVCFGKHNSIMNNSIHSPIRVPGYYPGRCRFAEGDDPSMGWYCGHNIYSGNVFHQTYDDPAQEAPSIDFYGANSNTSKKYNNVYAGVLEP